THTITLNVATIQVQMVRIVSQCISGPHSLSSQLGSFPATIRYATHCATRNTVAMSNVHHPAMAADQTRPAKSSFMCIHPPYTRLHAPCTRLPVAACAPYGLRFRSRATVGRAGPSPHRLHRRATGSSRNGVDSPTSVERLDDHPQSLDGSRGVE